MEFSSSGRVKENTEGEGEGGEERRVEKKDGGGKEGRKEGKKEEVKTRRNKELLYIQEPFENSTLMLLPCFFFIAFAFFLLLVTSNVQSQG
jgi:hypothetical protein